ncbi:ATP-dependent DNA helicase PIF1 [Grifola frondosa]|uniref:ATP-dependent DNA helicase PIF1 n=1 Tax=Grifola frondosa TaxID=5627 RepID=A0A1C7MA88_GRIFR|nr:ATP-dependent DNA helicase PIF1 [Grifola frondosa]
MAPSSKQPMSGLRTVKRDFSSSSIPTASQESASTDADAIPWSATPPKKKLTGLEQRLKDIQDALNGQIVSSEKVLASKPFASQLQPPMQKRPSSSQDPPAKRRQLPSSWNDPAAYNSRPAYPTASSAGNFGSTRQANRAYQPPPLIVAADSKNGAVSKPAPVFLSQEQTHILKLVQERQSLFYTGSAGTGKSVLLREIIKTLRRKHSKSPDAVAVTASTGIAACNIGGVTIHSFAGIGLGIESAEQLVSKIKKNKKASARWLRTQVLIIDEVSMVEGDLFDKLARIGSMMRKKVEPFGGIQVIVTGDFFQLPPVMKGSGNVKFAFEADMWSQTIKKTFNLTKVFRQRDPEFVDMLNEMRFGRLSEKSSQKFKDLSREIIYEDGLGATELFPRREDVERSNAVRMSVISTEEKVYLASDGGMITDQQHRDKMLANFMAPQRLALKLGAQVMLIKNMDETLVNGTMGKIVDFVDPSAAPVADDDHSGVKPGSKGPKETKKASSGIRWPLVEFLQPGGGRRRVMVQPETWKVELPNGEVQVSRTQMPLILAWAMSIHKSQGQTLERVKVDLAKVFEKGQAYVALSRATSLDGLQVLNFDPTKV